MVALTGSRSGLIYKPLPVDDPLQRKPDITLARGKMGWEPNVQLREGLVKIIAYIQEMR